MKMYEFRLRFHWSLFLRVQLTIFQHWFRWWLDADQATSHYLYQWWLGYWRIYASLGLNELKYLWMIFMTVMFMSNKLDPLGYSIFIYLIHIRLLTLVSVALLSTGIKINWFGQKVSGWNPLVAWGLDSVWSRSWCCQHPIVWCWIQMAL